MSESAHEPGRESSVWEVVSILARIMMQTIQLSHTSLSALFKRYAASSQFIKYPHMYFFYIS